MKNASSGHHITLFECHTRSTNLRALYSTFTLCPTGMAGILLPQRLLDDLLVNLYSLVANHPKFIVNTWRAHYCRRL